MAAVGPQPGGSKAAPVAQPILRMRRIVKEFPGVQALAGVDLEVLPGEVHALVGENGAGKSTLIHILGGVHQPDGGEIILGGQPVAIPTPRRARELGVAERVWVTGLVERQDLAAHISHFDIALQPEVTAYASPLKLFEYMWCEIPLVSSDFPNLRHIIDAAQCGICIDPCDAERAAVAIMDLLDQPELLLVAHRPA